ncbi:hypothetical protein AOQ84DRAFT_101564 [Glonium stellatum]|uniref:Uncharacterized protein n=1 Tax=Glonium stellatum TaxID=574774 RepID=A0A8E2EUL2_9PEZI|nr:hypothetical protein AOQ84DRAFT_101564 [Glonium stellatum]
MASSKEIPTIKADDDDAASWPSPIPHTNFSLHEQIRISETLRKKSLEVIEEHTDLIKRYDERIAYLRKVAAARDANTRQSTSMVASQRIMYSPPPAAALSPFLPMQTLYAGHTPPVPWSPDVSDWVDDESPEEYLSGPLTLPANPTVEDDDTFSVNVLASKLEDLAKEMKASLKEPKEKDTQLVKKIRSGEGYDVVDGVLLKKQRMNFGRPLGSM